MTIKELREHLNKLETEYPYEKDDPYMGNFEDLAVLVEAFEEGKYKGLSNKIECLYHDLGLVIVHTLRR